MKTLLFFFILTTTAASADQLQIKKAQVDSLDLPFTLEELLSHLESTFHFDKPLLIERKWLTIRSYYSFKATKKELNLVSNIKKNLSTIVRLFQQKKETADISDIDYLKSTTELAITQIQFLKTTEVCRSHYLDIIQACNMEVIIAEKTAKSFITD